PSNVVIAAATSVTGVTFTPGSLITGATSNWSIGFTPSASGTLTAGDKITVVFNAAFTVPASPAILLIGGFSNCGATAATVGSTTTITLSDDGGTCSLAALTPSTHI